MTEKSQSSTPAPEQSATSLRRQVCHPLTLPDADHAARLYTDVFLADEPTTHRHALDPSSFLHYAELYVRVLVGKELSFMVRDMETGEPAGFIFCLDLTDDPEQEGPGMVTFLSYFREAIIMIQELEDRHFNLAEIPTGSILHIFQIGVGRNFRGNGIARMMIRRVENHARERGFSRIVADCTSFASKRAFEQCGFKETGYYPYDEFCMNGVRFFEGLDRGISLMVRDLESSEQE